jgi:PAS domain S-box-containing protein
MVDDPMWTSFRADFRIIAEQAPFMIWMTAPDGNCYYLNPAWTEFTGQAREGGYGTGWRNVIHPDDRDLVLNRYVEATSNHRTYELQYRLHRKGDGYSWVSAIGRAYFNDDGSCAGYVGSIIAAAVKQSAATTMHLSPREVEVLEFIAAGKTAEEIAIILALSPRTVEFHVFSAMAKTNTTNRVQAVVEAIRSGQIRV